MLPPWIHPFSRGGPFGRLPVWAARNKASVNKAFVDRALIPEGRPPRGEFAGCRVFLHPWLSADAVRPCSEGAVNYGPDGTS